ncbi:DUF6552 family protein [Dinoroseobacter sp. S76]|uniref:DUF6552 family protein n=1 Tax=Dinoroseobacter sp. S76 TaxID=3415124 RepID=UPI003C7EAB2B
MPSDNGPPNAATHRDQARLVFTVKWGASVLQIMGYAATGFGWTPLNVYLFLGGLLGWFAVGVFWKDKALMLVHAVALTAMIAGMFSR